jgi:TonB family protein
MKTCILLCLLLPNLLFAQQTPVLIGDFPESRFEGGSQAFYRDLSRNIKYPRKARQIGNYGTSIVSITLSPEGNYTKFEVLNSLGRDIDREVERAFKLLEKDFLPNQQSVPVKMRFIISFMLGPIDLLRSPYDSAYFMDEVKVVAYVKKMPSHQPNARLIDKMSQAIEKEKHKKVLKYAERLIRRDPFNQSLHSTRINSLIALERTDEACKAMDIMEQLLRLRLSPEIRAKHCNQ